MKTKEELIKEAWGENYSKDVIMKGRRCGFKIIDNMEYNLNYKGGDWYCEPDTFETIAFMPTSLRQILNNNGWIRIESEDDLPKELIGRTFVYTNKGNIYNYSQYIQWFSISETETITHYKIISEINPPLY